MPEMRQNPVTKRWVIIATERAKRPEQQKINIEKEDLPAHREDCFFCWHNEHTTPPEVYAVRLDDSKPDSAGWLLRVVNNKFAALNLNNNFEIKVNNPLQINSYAAGVAEVVIETNNHSLCPSQQSLTQTIRIIKAFVDRYKTLAENAELKYINIFRNCGALAGASLEHPHSQIIATPVIPPNIIEELTGSNNYYQEHNTCIYCDEIQQELKEKSRIVYENKYFVSFAPYASRTPFELVIMPKFHSARFETLDVQKISSLSEVWKATFQKLDAGLNYPPYNCYVHTAPTQQNVDDCYHWHIEIIPKLTITAGFELCSGIYINVTIPEECADFLRNIELEQK